MKAEETPNVEALTAILTALKSLDRDAQTRTLQAVATFLGLSLTKNSNDVLHENTHISLPIANNVKQGVTFSENRTISPKEFLRDKAPKTDIEKVACLAYYLTHYREVQYFKTLDISTLNTEAAQPKFSNAAVAMENASRSGFLVQGIKGTKQLTALGEGFVQALPDREAAKNLIQSGREKRRVKKSSFKKAPKKR